MMRQKIIKTASLGKNSKHDTEKSYKHILGILVAITIILLSASCTARQNINIDKTGKGSCTVKIELNSFFVNYLQDLSDAARSSESDSTLFDKKVIKEIFKQYSAAKLSDLRIKGNSFLEADIVFNNPGDILYENKLNPVISYSSDSGISTLSFNLNLENYKALSIMTGLDTNPVLAALLPQPENPYTSDEYLEMLDFIFSDYEGGDKAALTVAKSMVEIAVTTDGEILYAQNAKAEKGRAVFKIPLLDFLTLSKPVVFSVKYRS